MMDQKPLNIVYLTPGAGGMFCGSCLSDNMLARAATSKVIAVDDFAPGELHPRDPEAASVTEKEPAGQNTATARPKTGKATVAKTVKKASSKKAAVKKKERATGKT